MRTDRGKESYWTLIDSTGKIHALPRTLGRVLNSQDWTSMSTQSLSGSQNQILLKSKNNIAAFRLTNKGQVIDFVEFEAEHKDAPNIVASAFFGNYKHELYQLVIVGLDKKTKTEIRTNSEPNYCP